MAGEEEVKEKTAAQLQRESITVTKNNPDVVEEKEEAEEVVEEKEEIVEAKEDDEGEEKEEAEEVEAKSVEKLERTIARLQKRLDKETGNKKDLQKELNAAKLSLEATFTEADVQTRAEQIAAEKVLQKEFTNACNKLAAEATKIDKQFDKKVKVMGEDIGAIPSAMIGILEDLDNGGAILAHLVNNVDEAEEIYSLSLAKMSLRLSKLSEKLLTKPKKDISKVPAPNEPVSPSSKTSTVLRDNEPMEDWVKKRNAQVEERRKARIGR
jgi:hypothetical protein